MNFKAYSLKSALGALTIGAGLLLGGSQMTYAQDHHQWHERQDLGEHQRRERYLYGDSPELREHQWREWRQLERHQYHERRGYYDWRYNRGYGQGWGWGWRRRHGW